MFNEIYEEGFNDACRELEKNAGLKVPFGGFKAARRGAANFFRRKKPPIITSLQPGTTKGGTNLVPSGLSKKPGLSNRAIAGIGLGTAGAGGFILGRTSKRSNAPQNNYRG